MYPVLFTIPFIDLPISSFGAMLAIGFLVAWWLFARQFEERGLDPELASTVLIYAALGGVLGAKLYFAIDVGLIRKEGPFFDLLLNRGGMTWYGGLLGAIALTTLGTRIHGLSTRVVANTVAAVAPFGQALGRIGCFLVGDDYGQQTEGWWAVSFPNGAPPTIDPVTGELFSVHPTMLYEVAWLVPIGFFLWFRRHTSHCLFGEYLMLTAIGRFGVEFLRTNPEVALGITSAQWIAMGLFVAGAVLCLYDKPQAKA